MKTFKSKWLKRSYDQLDWEDKNKNLVLCNIGLIQFFEEFKEPFQKIRICLYQKKKTDTYKVEPSCKWLIIHLKKGSMRCLVYPDLADMVHNFNNGDPCYLGIEYK